MNKKLAEIPEILPKEKKLVSANDLPDKLISEATGAATMLVDYLAFRCQHTLPTDLPRAVRKIDIFDIEWIEEGVEPLQPKKFLAVQSDSASMSPQHRNVFLIFIAKSAAKLYIRR